jgi:hypothetical protein
MSMVVCEHTARATSQPTRRKRRYCKYCYSTHNDWSLMDHDEYLRPDDKWAAGCEVFLCERCSHTSVMVDERYPLRFLHERRAIRTKPHRPQSGTGKRRVK